MWKEIRLEKKKVSGKKMFGKNSGKKKRIKIGNLYIVVITIVVMSKAHFRSGNGSRSGFGVRFTWFICTPFKKIPARFHPGVLLVRANLLTFVNKKTNYYEQK